MGSRRVVGDPCAEENGVAGPEAPAGEIEDGPEGEFGQAGDRDPVHDGAVLLARALVDCLELGPGDPVVVGRLEEKRELEREGKLRIAARDREGELGRLVGDELEVEYLREDCTFPSSPRRSS